MPAMKQVRLTLIVTLMLAPLWLISAEPPPSSDIDRKVDSLFVIASSGELKYRDMVEPGKDSIAAMGGSAVPRLIEKYETKDAREQHAINDILVKIGADAVDLLVKALSLENAQQVSRICYTLGNIGDSAGVEGLIAAASHFDWRVRSGAAGALGKIGDSRADTAVSRSLSDMDGMVRKSAAVAAGKLMIYDAIPTLVHMLGDDFYGARMTASDALVGLGEEVIAALADSLGSQNILLGNLGCTTLGRIGGDSAAAVLAGQLDSGSPVRRALAVEGILVSNSSIACGSVELLSETEEDSLVIFYIRKVLDKYAAR